jgi:hypothetical protein
MTAAEFTKNVQNNTGCFVAVALMTGGTMSGIFSGSTGYYEPEHGTNESIFETENGKVETIDPAEIKVVCQLRDEDADLLFRCN